MDSGERRGGARFEPPAGMLAQGRGLRRGARLLVGLALLTAAMLLTGCARSFAGPLTNEGAAAGLEEAARTDPDVASADFEATASRVSLGAEGTVVLREDADPVALSRVARSLERVADSCARGVTYQYTIAHPGIGTTVGYVGDCGDRGDGIDAGAVADFALEHAPMSMAADFETGDAPARAAYDMAQLGVAWRDAQATVNALAALEPPVPYLRSVGAITADGSEVRVDVTRLDRLPAVLGIVEQARAKLSPDTALTSTVRLSTLTNGSDLFLRFQSRIFDGDRTARDARETVAGTSIESACLAAKAAFEAAIDGSALCAAVNSEGRSIGDFVEWHD